MHDVTRQYALAHRYIYIDASLFIWAAIRKILRMFLHISMCQSMLTHYMPDAVTVGHCGVSKVKNYINTVQFIAQTDCFNKLFTIKIFCDYFFKK